MVWSPDSPQQVDLDARIHATDLGHLVSIAALGQDGYLAWQCNDCEACGRSAFLGSELAPDRSI